jgi:RHS repeat-associated protein
MNGNEGRETTRQQQPALAGEDIGRRRRSARSLRAQSTKAWTRSITGVDGSLVAIQNNGATPVLELTNLHGDIIATASLSETATELASKTDTSEFGVPTVSNPEKFAWLGAIGLPTELPSGVIAMGARSYVPQLGRFLQPDPIPGGSANAYSYTFDDPVNSTDPTGDYVEGAYLAAFNNIQNREAVERQEAREAAARAAAEQAAREAAEAAAAAAGPQYAGGEEEYWEEWYEEEGWYEYATYHHDAGKEEARVEPAVLYQPLREEASNDDSGANGPEGWSRVEIKGGPGGHGCAKRKACHKGGPRRGENQEWCEFVGGAIGGLLGAPGGVGGGIAGGAAGTVAGKVICKE